MTNIHSVKPNILTNWLDLDKAVLIDVRERNEYKEESIANSKNIPLSEFTIEKINLVRDLNKKLVFHCRSGIRSMTACEKIQESGAEYDVWNLEGGILAWKDAGMNIKT